MRPRKLNRDYDELDERNRFAHGEITIDDLQNPPQQAGSGAGTEAVARPPLNPTGLAQILGLTTTFSY